MAHDTRASVIATRLDRCIRNPTHLKHIRDAVERTHRIVTDGTELIALHLTKCLQTDVTPPRVEANWVKCAVYHNCDYNVSFNIGVRFKTLFWPHLYAATYNGPEDTDDVDATRSALSTEFFAT